MPSVAEKSSSVDLLASQFPVTLPIPTPTTNSSLLSIKDVQREEDLLRNPSSFRAWWTAIHTTKEAFNAQLKAERRTNVPNEAATLLGPLATPLARHSLQCLTYLYEAAIAQFPGSFKLWKSYLQMRMSYVLGRQVIKKRAGGRKKLPEMKDALEEEKEDLESWEDGLDGVVGWGEWRSLIATYERALMWLPKLPRLWLMYSSVFFHPMCPSLISHTHARRTFDRALRTLPPSLHSRIWVRYLLWAETKGGSTTVSVYRRYLAVDPSVTEHYTSILLSPADSVPRPLEAAKLLLSLARKASRGEYVSPEGKSPYQLLGDFLDIVERFSDDVGFDVDATIESNDANAKIDAEAARTDAQPTSMDGQLVRTDGPSGPVGAGGIYDEDEDPLSPRKLNIEHIVHKDGLEVYKDQAGRLWTGLATYWIKRGEFDRAISTFEAGIATVLTIRDFTQIFDAYAEFCESLINAMMESLENPEEEEEEEDENTKETEQEMDIKMKEFEALIDRRPFLVNDVLLRRNPNDVQEWEKRVALWGEDDEKVADTYTKALETINPRKATANLHRLYVNFAKFYEEGGSSGSAEPDLDSARNILEKATKINFKAVEDLADIWCEWSEMELRHENYDEAVRVMQRAAAIPKNTKINYHDHSLPVQARLFKSLKLWSFYVDLEESIGTVESTKAGASKLEQAHDLFEQVLEKFLLKSCKPLFLMYGQLEEDYGLAKRAMSIYERATQVVADENKFEMYTIYIAKATANYGLPATRPIFERALEVLPDKQTAEMCLRFAALERKLGEIDRARAIYAHASQFCDPRVNPKFWLEWNSFEIETGSEDTFREMLRIKRSVQAQFNTEASYLAAQTLSAKQNGTAEQSSAVQPADPMAAAEQQARGPAFVAAKKTALPRADEDQASSAPDLAPQQADNDDEIHISDEED
ncbi:hypothetical protein BDR04DRAFT_1090805 [Suillus decipiens]|nr:hypothetical protein BDR04DRAFT_1090805 [Suillus decipiens]